MIIASHPIPAKATIAPKFRLGRMARRFDRHIPHYAMVKMMPGIPLRPPLLQQVNHADKLPGDVGMMLNDSLGCCTCAGIYHALQVWGMDAHGLDYTEPDGCVLKLYEDMGYKPGDPMTDQGVVEQVILEHLTSVGMPLADGSRHKLAAYVEVDPRNFEDVCEVIQEFGVAYIGFEVPKGFMETGPTNRWDASSSFGAIEGGHCVIVTGFDRSDHGNPTFNVISWGTKQWVMTADFWRRYVDECYLLIDTLWIQQNGLTPLNLNYAQLVALAQALRDA